MDVTRPLAWCEARRFFQNGTGRPSPLPFSPNFPKMRFHLFRMGDSRISLMKEGLYISTLRKKIQLCELDVYWVGKCPANRNVLRSVKTLAQWFFLVDVTREVKLRSFL